MATINTTLDATLPPWYFNGSGTVGVVITDTFTVSGYHYEFADVTDSFTMSDEMTLQFTETVTDTFEASSNFEDSPWYSSITETVEVNETLVVNATHTLTSYVKVGDSLTFTHTGSLTETFEASSTMTDSRTVTIIESFTVGETVTGIYAPVISETSTFEASDSVISSTLELFITETFVFTGERSNVGITQTLTESADVDDSVVPHRTHVATFTETVDVGDWYDTSGSTFTITSTDTFKATDSIWAKDLTALAWVMNTETNGLSQYDNFEFTSLAVHNGVLYATSPEGIFEINSETDNGRNISARYKTGLLDFSTEQKKRLSSIYISHTGGDLECSVETYDDIDNTVYTYLIEERAADAPRNNRIRVGKGLTSRYWRFTFNNVDGADFQIHDVAVELGVSNRRL